MIWINCFLLAVGAFIYPPFLFIVASLILASAVLSARREQERKQDFHFEEN